ncbi:porin [Prosthecomicrobium sp. N25]|uniref:porin n=1 Tax=Prosthecomicrobium sp. N25 TaxID=3129254 RepID=UPI003078A598
MKFKYATMAAAMLAATGASAADLGRPAPAAVDYVKVCDAYGTGFFYIPGTETCLKIDGYVRADYRYQSTTPYLIKRAGGAVTNRYYFGGFGATPTATTRNRNDIFTRARALLHFDARTNTEFGLLRSYAEVFFTTNSGDNGGVATSLDQAFIQFGGLTAGRAQSFFDFITGYAYGMHYHETWPDSKTNLLAYTFSFGNGVSASLSLEDPSTSGRRRGTANFGTPVPAFTRNTIGGAGVLAPFFSTYDFGYQGVKVPDVVGQLAIAQAWGKAQLSVAAHHVYGTGTAVGGPAAAPVFGTVYNKDDWGYAVGAGVEVNLPMIAPGDKIFAEAFYGKGAMSYVCVNCFNAYGHLGADAVIGTRGKLGLTEAWSLSGGFYHAFSAQWDFSVSGGYAAVDGLGANDYDQYEVAGTLRWKPVAGLQIGATAEYRNLEFSNATRAYYSAPGVAALKNNDSYVFGLRVQRNF